MKVISISILILELILGSGASSAASLPQSDKVDEFNFIKCDDELMRMFHYRDYLNAHPHTTAYLIVYGGHGDKRGAVGAHAARLKDLLVNSLGILPGRAIVVVGGYREQSAVELCCLPPYAKKPTPRATLKPSDVRFGKERIPKAQYTWSSQCS